MTADTPHAKRDDAGPSEVPSVLDLIRLSPRLLFPPGGKELYRQIALLVDLSPDDEVVIAGCGNGVTLEYFVTDHGAHGQGVDVDGELITEAESRARDRGLSGSMQFQQAPMERLPYRDAIFDVAIGELGLTHGAEPARAVEELVRVTRPGGSVILVQPVWKAPVDEARRRLLSSYLGVSPLMLVEWKRLLRENGVEHIHTEDWTDEETAFRPQVVKPFPDFDELFSLGEKIGILRRAWRRWGWPGVRAAVTRERAVRRLLTRERVLGLDLLKGIRSVEGDVGEAVNDQAAHETADIEAGGGPAQGASGNPAESPDMAEDGPHPPGEDLIEEAVPTADPAHPRDGGEEDETAGLPLFSPEDETEG